MLVPLHLTSCVRTHTTHHNTRTHNTIHTRTHTDTRARTHTHTHQRTHTHGAHTMVPQIPGDINFPVTTTGQEPHQSLRTVDTATDHTKTDLQTLLQHCTSNTRAVVHKCMIYRQIHAHTRTHAHTHVRQWGMGPLLARRPSPIPDPTHARRGPPQDTQTRGYR